MHSSVELVRPIDRHRVPWKNGAGITSEIAAGDFWRVNIMVDDTIYSASVRAVDLREEPFTTDSHAITAVYVHSGHTVTAGPGDCLIVHDDAIEINGIATILAAEIQGVGVRSTDGPS